MPTGVYLRKPEHKRTYFKKGSVPWNKGMRGTHFSLATEFRPGKKSKNWNGFKKGLIPWNSGTRGQGICRANSGTFKSGKHYSRATEFKKGGKGFWTGKSRPNLSLQNHPNWRGGVAFFPYPLGWTRTFKEQIGYRDKYKCRVCGVSETDCVRRLSIHHIDYNKKNLRESNLLSICSSCHGKTQWNRAYWKRVLSKLAKR